jgi:hypothetical protein
MARTLEIDMRHGQARTCARTALIALVHWHAAHMPPDPSLPEFPEPFEVYVSKRPIPGPGDPLLLPLCVAVCERSWNRAPRLPEGEREEQALYLLKWLRKYGDVSQLEIKGKEYDPAEFPD